MSPANTRPRKPSPEKPEWLEHLSVLRLEPGDTLVFRTSATLSVEATKHIRELAERKFPGHQALVLVDGMEIGVVREASREG